MNPYLDAVAAYGLGSSHMGGFAHTIELLNQLSITTDDIVIEIGCGTGRTACHIATNHGAHVFAVDSSGEMLAKARKRAGQCGAEVNFIQGDAQDLPFLDNVADLIFIESVLIFASPKRVLKECRRVLKKGALLVDTEPFADSTLPDSARQQIEVICKVSSIPTYEDWVTLIESSGFKLGATRRDPYPGLMTNLKNVFYPDPLQNILGVGVDSQAKQVLESYKKVMQSNRRHLGYGTFIARKV